MAWLAMSQLCMRLQTQSFFLISKPMHAVQDIDGQLRPIMRRLQTIMPAFDVESKLHEGTGVWWSAADMLRNQGRRFKYLN